MQHRLVATGGYGPSTLIMLAPSQGAEIGRPPHHVPMANGQWSRIEAEQLRSSHRKDLYNCATNVGQAAAVITIVSS